MSLSRVPDLGDTSTLGLLLEALHDWTFKPAGEDRDTELGLRIHAIKCARIQSTLVTDDMLQTGVTLKE